jgi:hypothetical protein
MAFQMSYSKEELSGAPPIPAGKYTLQLKVFKPKASALKPGETESSSLNLNPELVVINHPDYEGRRIFWNMNTKGAFIFTDFVHACGLQMEEVQNEYAGTAKASYTLPGVFEGADDPKVKPEDWKYLGPLTNKTLEVEVAETPAQTGADGKFYKAKNEIRQFFCAIPNCQEKHSTNLIK